MAAKLFVGSLPYTTTDEELADMFSDSGTVVSAKVIIDRDTGRSKGFGFVEMSTDEEAKKAISDKNGASINGRTIVVNEARPQENRGGGGGFGGNRGGGDRREYSRDRRY